MTQAREAAALCQRVPLRLLWVQSILIRGLSQCGSHDEAVALAEQMLTSLMELGGGYIEVSVRSAAAQALTLGGKSARAQKERQKAAERLQIRAEHISDSTSRDRYLTSQRDLIV